VSVYLDANIVIYLVERHPVWGTRAQSRITHLRTAGEQTAISDAHRLERLVGPLILSDQTTLAVYLASFNDPGVISVLLPSRVWERAARIRAVHHLKPPDSLHLAAAVENGCRRFLTDDVQLGRFPDITAETLS
jgi:uncharacterized protein